MKLQQAYFSESSKAGGWQLIGYMAPGVDSKTTNFNYDPGAIKVAASDDLESAQIGWQASNTANLNDCSAGTNWPVTLTKTTTGLADITFTAAAKGAGCIALTPTFDKIGK